MSREVRRVPLDWKHPTEPNPYWREQTAQQLHHKGTLSRLHMPQERFIGLVSDYPGRLADWEQEKRDIEAREGRHWAFQVEYHLTGYQGHEDDAPVVHPFYTWSDDGQTEIPVEVRDEDHLHELVMAQHAGEKPDPADYMPVFDVPESELGWCLYETVSEGTPCTPVFATAEDLVEHLATVGQDYDQIPMRRESAQAVVDQGGTFGSMLAVGGNLYRSDTDADKIAEAFAERRSTDG